MTIREITKEQFTLTHSRHRDEMGILRDYFKLTETLRQGNRVHYPFFPPFKVKAFGPLSDIRDDTNNYTDAEYETIFNDAITAHGRTG